MQEKSRDFIGALQKGFVVIEAFGALNDRMTLSEVARKTGLTRPTARRYLLSLARLGYAESDGRHFWLTHRVLRLGYAYLSSASLPRIAHPILNRISERTREATSLSTIEGGEIIFLASSVAPRIMAASITVGLRLPAYCTAAGRVLLSSFPDEEVENRLRACPRRKLTRKTKVGISELLQEIDRARSNGYALNDEEQELGLRSIAVPLSIPKMQLRLAMSVSVHAGRMQVHELVHRIFPILRTAKRDLELIG